MLYLLLQLLLQFKITFRKFDTMHLSVIRKLKNDFYKSIESLPDDIKRKIYKEYFEIPLKEDRIYKVFRLINKCDKNHIFVRLTELIKQTIDDEELLKSITKSNPLFARVYNEFVNDTIIYTLIKDPYHKFAYEWIYSCYH